jgi:transcriptional regulator with XRE-family HTH domain
MTLPLHVQVRAARERNGISQKQLAIAADTSQTQVSLMETPPAQKRGKNRRGVFPSVELLGRVAKALNATFVIDAAAVE